MIYTSCIWGVFCFDSPKCVLDFGLMTSPDKDAPLCTFTKWSSRVVFGCWCCGAKLEILWCREWWWKHRSSPLSHHYICLMLCSICNYFSLQFTYCREAKSKDFFQGWLKRYEVFSNVMIPMSFAWISCPSHTQNMGHIQITCKDCK
jgi:hypothetical protein